PNKKIEANLEIFTSDKENIHVRINKINGEITKISKLFNNSSLYVWIKDLDGRYIHVNESLLKLENQTYNEMIGKTDYEIRDKALADAYKNQDEEVIKNNKLCTYNSYNWFAEEPYYYGIIKWPHIDENTGSVIGVVGIMIENTKNIKELNELRKNNRILHEISNNIDEVVIIYDDEKVFFVSPVIEKMYGINKPQVDELRKTRFTCDVWDEVYVEKQLEEYNYKGIATHTFKVSKGNETKWLHYKSHPILDKDNNVFKRVGIISDITAHRQVREEIEDLRMEFFSNLSHELRTPINVIISSIQLMQSKINKLDYDNYVFFEKYVNILRQNGLRLLKLVNNLIDTTKLNSGSFSYNPENADIISFVESICMSVSDFVEQNNLSIIFDTDVEEKVIAYDKDNLERIMLNLISNAIKFNKENGSINVEIKDYDEEIKIIVKDSGVGIPKEKLYTVFEKFEQVKSKLKNEKEGSGIGLSLVKSLVEMHDGSIELRSEIDLGSEFIISLPIKLVDGGNYTDYELNNRFSNVSNLSVEFSDIY
ncbi:MAG: PAS domain-containing sensor histidine kinase, partial [Peptostreptococcaceae bacterium]